MPVFFNAWRFEKDKHIIIPLFQTLVSTLGEYKDIPAFNKIYAQAVTILHALKQGLQAPKEQPDIKKLLGGDLTQLKKLASFFNPQEVAKNINFDNMLDDLLTNNRIESIYLHIPQWIERLSFLNNVKFLFLVDDLDRCLPENTLKMLESIKLFLDVPGCSFVLAIDDDVVERGVEHHYREYRLQNNQVIYINQEEDKTATKHSEHNSAEAPITGSEYLEKIVQLPFRIPPNDTIDIESFILSRYKELFYTPVAKENNTQEQRDEKLLKLFVDTTPPYPRKLIRVLSLYKTKLKIIKKFDSQANKELIAKIAMLELFAPKLYRFLKNSLLEFERLHQWWNDENINSLSETNKISGWIEQNIKNQKEQELTKKINTILREVNSARVAFNLDNIFKEPFNREMLQSYIQLKESKKESAAGIKEENITKSLPANKEEFESYLFSNDPISWQKAFSEDANLKETYLDIKNYEDFTAKAKEYMTTPDWLAIVAKHLSKDDLIDLVKSTNLIEALAKENTDAKR